jgi:hypothetical protein
MRPPTSLMMGGGLFGQHGHARRDGTQGTATLHRSHDRLGAVPNHECGDPSGNEDEGKKEFFGHGLQRDNLSETVQ